MKQKFKWLLALVAMVASVNVLGAEYKAILTMDVAKNAPTGTTTTALTDASAVKTYLQSACPNTSDIKSVTEKTGDVYKGKGQGGGDIPQKCLKIGKASGGGGFTFTIADSFDDVTKVEITGYGWKTNTAVSVNGSATQSPTVAQSQEYTFSYEIEATKTITIAVTASAFCVTEIKLYKSASEKTDVYLNTKSA